MKNLGVIAALVLLSTGGCTSEKQSNRIQKTKALPPLPGYHLQSAKPVSPVGEFFAAQERRLVIRWENQTTLFASNYVTGVEATIDFHQWKEVARIPYTTTGIIQLTNRSEKEFYRIYNALKGM